jgi:hypothetical protein
MCVCRLSYPARNVPDPSYIVICGLPASATFFHIISQTVRFLEKLFISNVFCFSFTAKKTLVADRFINTTILPPCTKAAWVGHRNAKYLCLPSRSDLRNHRKISAAFLPETPSCRARFHNLLTMCHWTVQQVGGPVSILLEPAARRKYSLQTYGVLMV